MTREILKALSLAALVCGLCHGQLWVDFNSTSQDGGPHNDSAYQAYDAEHELAADFDTKNYSAFGTMVGVTPSFPNTTDNRVQQMIDRGAGNDANYTDPGAYSLDLVTDWIGVDTRTANGGNGNYDGTTGTATLLDLTLSGLPADSYNWTSIHHDTENVFSNFNVWVDTGAGFSQVGSGYQSDSSPGGSPTSGNEIAGPASTFAATFAADGTNDVVVRFEPLSGELADSVHNQLFAVNGFQLSSVPEPGTGVLMLMASLGAFGFARRRR